MSPKQASYKRFLRSHPSAAMDLARYVLVLLAHNAIFSRYLPANCISDPAACNIFFVSLNALLNQSYPGVESDGLAACIWRIYDTDLDGQISFR